MLVNPDMGLRAKLNLMLISLFSLGLLSTGFILHEVLQSHSRDEVVHNAGIMMEAAGAIRHYTVEQIKPLLEAQLATEFLPQSVPAYAATENFQKLRQNYPDYTYKEATLNPTNPRDRATDWETDVVEKFRNDESLKEFIGTRDGLTGKLLYLSRPIRIKDPACLSCHDTFASAPRPMLKKYGLDNGFGWKLNEVVGAQIVSVPLAIPEARARKTFITVIGSLTAVFIVIAVALNIFMHLLILTPVRKIAQHADQVSSGALDSEELKFRNTDEIGLLATSINRMRRSLRNAMELLDRE